eukprot:TRINITY_DN45218_c0_g1_i2.p1 TRINITY_DN45218_c0_g1~~TRINITY_DN45218_c0_g1_i2.p1  ORF type:complete len:125 (-),score=28.37 TRINITY_DN45218_c0_g1_i2:716-1090(-)
MGANGSSSAAAVDEDAAVKTPAFDQEHTARYLVQVRPERQVCDRSAREHGRLLPGVVPAGYAAALTDRALQDEDNGGLAMLFSWRRRDGDKELPCDSVLMRPLLLFLREDGRLLEGLRFRCMST